MTQEITRYYYKSKDGKGWLNLKTPDFDHNPSYDKISKEEWDAHVAELEQLAQKGKGKHRGK